MGRSTVSSHRRWMQDCYFLASASEAATHLAFLAVRLLRHIDEWVGSQTSLAEDRRLC